MHDVHHMSCAPSSGLSQFPASVEFRPRALTVAGADAVVRQAISLIKDCIFKDDFLNRRWPQFLAEMQSRDQIWVFETSGYGSAKRQGLALERNGYVLTILVLPDEVWAALPP